MLLSRYGKDARYQEDVYKTIPDFERSSKLLGMEGSETLSSGDLFGDIIKIY
jgi:hypothetical protein